jgi:hypothetical protein
MPDLELFMAEMHFVALTDSIAAARQPVNTDSRRAVATPALSAALITAAQSEAFPPAATRVWEAFTVA